MLKQIRIDPYELQRTGPKFVGFIVIYDRANLHPLLLGCKPKYYLDVPRQITPTWITPVEAAHFGQARSAGFWAYQLPHRADDQDVAALIAHILQYPQVQPRLAPDGVLWVAAPGKKSLCSTIKTHLSQRKLLENTN